MGKRKSRAKPAPKKRIDKLETVFCCPFCNHGSGVECKMKASALLLMVCTRLTLDFCHEDSPINFRYSEWIDECERVNNPDHKEVN